MENTTASMEQKLIEGAARIMSELAQRYDFVNANLPPRVHEPGTDEAAGELMADMVILELKQCRTFPLKHTEHSLKQIRTRFLRYFYSSGFRQAAKLQGQTWAILEARREERDDEYPWLMYTLEYLLNGLMSLVGMENDLSTVIVHGRYLNFSAASDIKSLEAFHRRLPQFVGLFDYMDVGTLETISSLIPGTLVAPDWYDEQEFGDDSVDDDLALYRAISNRYPVLQRPHVIRCPEGPVKSITVMEFHESHWAQSQSRCLIAVPTFEGTDGSDVYFAILGRPFSRSSMLVSDEVSDPGAQIVYAVYKALGQAIEEEKGEAVDIDALLEELEEEIESEEV